MDQQDTASDCPMVRTLLFPPPSQMETLSFFLNWEGLPHGLWGSQFPDQKLNPGHSSESLEP